MRAEKSTISAAVVKKQKEVESLQQQVLWSPSPRLPRPHGIACASPY